MGHEPHGIARVIAEASFGDHLGFGLAHGEHAAEMIGVALGENDPAQRSAAHRREQSLVALGTVDEAGIDHHVAVGGLHQIGVGYILRHVDEVGERDRFLLRVTRKDKARERRTAVFLDFAHGRALSNPIITLADCGVPATPSASITLSKAKRWLISDDTFLRKRGRAATTSGISVG